MDKKSEGFAYLRQKYPKRSEAKMKERIFVDPKIKQLFETMILVQNSMLQKEDTGRHLKPSAETL